jgi:3'-5' exoribonuclease
MFAELQAAVAANGNAHLRALLEALLTDPAVAEGLKRAPAAKAIHHAWLGGLLEHVLSLLRLARLTAPHYPLVDADLLTAGIILHDLGKIRELGYARSFGYTTEGQLLGHMQIALRLVAEKLPGLPDFPPKLRNLVEHMILSHHGQLEFGSPKVPVFAEALMLHHLDNLDSKMETLRATLERDRASAGEWTGYNAALERSLLNKAKYLSDAPAPAAEPRQARPAAQQRKQATLFGESLRAAFNGNKEN